jgi:pimeloyl-ACP methyl ester carboxylesterase
MQNQKMKSNKKSRFFQFAGRILLAIIALLILTGLAGTAARANIRANTPPPGKMIDVGGYSLHLHCQGTGSPTVIIEAGQGGMGIQYANIQDEMSKFTQVCTYDRAGLGWSDLGVQPRSAAVIVDELHTLLSRSGIEGPYILTGHSLGGLYTLLYARTYPEDVAGMVLLDSVHMDRFVRAPQREIDSLRSIAKVMPVFYGLQTAIALTGIPALLPSGAGNTTGDSPDADQMFAAVAKSSLRYGAGVYQEMKVLEALYEEVRAARITSLNDIPVITISHSIPEGYMGFTPEEIDASEENWRAFQNELAGLSTQGRYILADGSGHNIHLDRPEIVLESIQSVLQDARVKASSQ